MYMARGEKILSEKRKMTRGGTHVFRVNRGDRFFVNPKKKGVAERERRDPAQRSTGN